MFETCDKKKMKKKINFPCRLAENPLFFPCRQKQAAIKKMKIAELNIGLSSKRLGEITPETALNELHVHDFKIITYRLQESQAEGEKETCLACKVELPENWQFVLELISNALGQDCIAIAGFIGHAPYDTFCADLWVSPELPPNTTAPYKITNTGDDEDEAILDLTKGEAALVQRVIGALENSYGGRYAPTLCIEKL